MLSVLVTFYNQRAYVDQAIESILMQKVDFEYEVLIGDDGSTDGTYERILYWQDKYPDLITSYQVIRDPKVHYAIGFRASQNRLNLLKHVKSKYFIYLDGDDYYIRDDKLKAQVEALEKPENADCSCCAHGMSLLYQDGRTATMDSVRCREVKVSFGSYWWKEYFHPNALLYRSENISRLDFELVGAVFNDNLITFAFARFGKMYYLPDVYACYRITDTGIWNGQNKSIGYFRTLMVYEIGKRIAPEFNMQTCFRALPLYRCVLREKIDLTESKMSRVYELAVKTGAEKTATLMEQQGGRSVQVSFLTRVGVNVVYALNAVAKRIVNRISK